MGWLVYAAVRFLPREGVPGDVEALDPPCLQSESWVALLVGSAKQRWGSLGWVILGEGELPNLPWLVHPQRLDGEWQSVRYQCDSTDFCLCT